MKHLKHFPRLIALSFIALTSTSCETVEGIKQDFSSISMPGTSTATEQVGSSPSHFLIDGDCPKIELVDELSMLNEFTNNTSPSEKSLISSVEMQKAQSTCSYGQRSVTVDLKLNFDGELGPEGRTRSSDTPFFSYPFFVAVTSSTGKILAKEVFAASVTYQAGQNTQNYVETMRQIIPVDSRSEGSHLKILVGFQLTQDQLAYNRKIIQAEAQAQAMNQADIETEQITIERSDEPATPTSAPGRAGPIDITTP